MDLVEQLAVEHNVDKCNHVRLPGTAVFSCLLEVALAGHHASQRALQDAYFRQTGNTADHSSFGKRLAKIPVEFFKGIYEHLYCELAPQATPGETQALRIRHFDATIVTISAKIVDFGLLKTNAGGKGIGKAQRSFKSIFSLQDGGLPRFLHLCTKQSEHSDNVALGEPILANVRLGDVCVFDAGMSDRVRMLAIHNANAYFLTRHTSQTLNVKRVVWEAEPTDISCDPPEKGQDTYQLLRVEECRFGSQREYEKFKGMPVLAIHGVRWDLRSKKWHPLVLMTNLPISADNTNAGPYSFAEVADLYRKRWDIEIFFKFIKHHFDFNHILSRTQNGVEVMIYMTMIASLLMIWYKRLTNNKNGWPSVKYFMANDATFWTDELMDCAIWTKVAARKSRPLRI